MDTDNIASKKVNIAINRIRDLRLPTYIHKNMKNGEKDFGVKLSKIEESVMKII